MVAVLERATIVICCTSQEAHVLYTMIYMCEDVDECELSLDTCDQRCMNTEGTYYCSCNHGYQLVNHSFCIAVGQLS